VVTKAGFSTADLESVFVTYHQFYYVEPLDYWFEFLRVTVDLCKVCARFEFLRRNQEYPQRQETCTMFMQRPILLQLHACCFSVVLFLKVDFPARTLQFPESLNGLRPDQGAWGCSPSMHDSPNVDTHIPAPPPC
jgi:hypothetical protein